MKTDKHLKKLSDILNAWKNDMDNFVLIENIRNSLMEAKTTSQLNDIIEDNINFIDNYNLWKMVKNAKKRIVNLNRIKLELTEKIYLN